MLPCAAPAVEARRRFFRALRRKRPRQNPGKVAEAPVGPTRSGETPAIRTPATKPSLVPKFHSLGDHERHGESWRSPPDQASADKHSAANPSRDRRPPVPRISQADLRRDSNGGSSRDDPITQKNGGIPFPWTRRSVFGVSEIFGRPMPAPRFAGVDDSVDEARKISRWNAGGRTAKRSLEPSTTNPRAA